MAARPRNPAKRLKKLSAPANDDEILEFTAACARAEVEPADTLRSLARAFALHVQEYGYITKPLRLASPPRDTKPP
jgi:hypothetical protein